MNIEIPRVTVKRALGKSALGTTYAATDYAGHDVVVEIASELHTPEYRARFLRDAMIAERLEGEHVLRVLDVGTTKDGHPFLVREPVLASIASEVRARGPLPADEAVLWALQACEAIAEGHALGMAHGDVRADNVFLARDSRGELVVKVRWTSAAKSEGAVKADQQRDIAGLGEVLRAMLSGQVDLSDEDRARTLPTPLADVIAFTVPTAGGPRFGNVGDLANALAPFAPTSEAPRNIAFMLSRAGIPAVPPRTTTPAWFDAAPRMSSTSIAPPPRRTHVASSVFAAALVAVVAIGSFWAWKTDRLPTLSAAADPAEYYGTTTLTSADITNEATSEDLAASVTDDGILQRSAPIAAATTPLKAKHAPREHWAVTELPPAVREPSSESEITNPGSHEEPTPPAPPPLPPETAP